MAARSDKTSSVLTPTVRSVIPGPRPFGAARNDVNETDVRDTTLAREVEEHHGDRRHVGDDHESCEIDQHERQHAHVDLAQRRVEYRLRSEQVEAERWRVHADAQGD